MLQTLHNHQLRVFHLPKRKNDLAKGKIREKQLLIGKCCTSRPTSMWILKKSVRKRFICKRTEVLRD